MNLAQTDEQRLFQDTLRRFLQAENDLESRRHRLSGSNPDRKALWPTLADIGAVGAMIEESHGGYAGDARTIAIGMAEAGRALVVEPLLATAVVAARILSHCPEGAGTEELSQIVAGGRIVVLAHDAGLDPFARPLTKASPAGRGYAVDGHVRCVRHADVADEILVTAQLGADLAIFRLAGKQVSTRSYRLIDGAAAADLHLASLQVEEAALILRGPAAQAALSDALDHALLGLGAEVSGIVEAANRATFRYLAERRQFGVPLASFQALQHRVADMDIACRQVSALLELAIRGFAPGQEGGRSALVHALKSCADTCGRIAGHDAIQLHGGMGVSDELDISHYGRRLAAIRSELGSADLHRQRFLDGAEVSALLAVQDTDESRAWRAEVADFTQRELPQALARKGRVGLKIEKADYVQWQQILRRKGYFASAWPRQHGGLDWDLLKQLLFLQESAACGAPMISPYGVNMVGPVIYTFGTEEQRRRHLPGILSSEVWWCQGYSEPGAGSDLAALKTQAVLDGDEYVVNGAKLWTTEAHWADWMHCLVRTSAEGKPQAGITFLLIDMKSPGISVKPIVTIDGLHHTNALFLDNVRVPAGNRIGREGQGWDIAKFLLSRERISIADTGPKLRLLRHVRQLFRQIAVLPDVPHAQVVLLGNRLADVSIQLLALCAMERQYVEAWAQGGAVGSEASVLKVRGTEVLQALCELGVDMVWPLGASHDPADAHLPGDAPLGPQQLASLMNYEYLYSRCWSIFGGTNEIQRNIIAKSALAA